MAKAGAPSSSRYGRSMGDARPNDAPKWVGPAPPDVVGPAHVGVASFLAARATPTGGFWVALAGGVALARVAERRGARLGFGASAAAMLETVAIIGPARFGVPLTQALTAPMLGRLHARGVGFWPQLAACGLVRLLHNAATTAFFIWVIAGGLDAYAGTYDAIGRRVGIDIGAADALVLTAASLLAWAVFASTVQVLVYRRGLRSWNDSTAEVPEGVWGINQSPGDRKMPHTPRFDPRGLTLIAVVTFALLLASTSWAFLAAIAAFLTVAWLITRADPQPLRAGAAFAAILAAGAFVFALGGGLGLDAALRRALRAALLVMTATWLRAAAGAEGLREVSRRALRRVRWIPGAPEASSVLDSIESESRLADAARALTARLADTPKRPRDLLDAVLAWVVRESSALEPRFSAPLAGSRSPMTTKSEFNAQEWDDITMAPALAALMVMFAERGGAIRESVALGKAYAAARRDGGSELTEQLVSSPPRLDPRSMGQPDQLRAQLPERIRGAIAIVDQKATPEEAQEYRDFILEVADVVAHAAKEGGVLGIGGKEVTDQEQAVLDELRGQLATASS